MSVRIVLVGTTHPGNIGSAARAMKTMGLEDLWLVAPGRFPAAEASVMAAGADDVLAKARVCDEVSEAIADCGFVVGTTARGRRTAWRVTEPREAAGEIAAAAEAGHVAVVFGAERSGLSNDQLKQCQLLVTIPTGSSYASLNLAMAVQLMSYEIRLAIRGQAYPVPRDTPLATAEEMEHFYHHLQQVLDEIEFHDRNGSGHLMMRLRRLFSRAVLDQNEANILRGILAAVQSRRRRAGDTRPLDEANPR